MKRRIVTLLTDFGTQDHYVASMKGVILGINPACTLVDISHEVMPHDVREGDAQKALKSRQGDKVRIWLQT